MPVGLLCEVQREIERCRAAVSCGSPRQFWIRRLDRARREIEQATLLLDDALSDLEANEAGAAPAPDAGQRGERKR